MAQKVNVVITSDLSDEEGAETVQFGFDGAAYEIDLTSKEKKEFEKAITKYLDAGRKSSAKRASASKAGNNEAKKIRDWAKSKGIDVPARGRVPAEVRKAYEAAN